MNSEYEQLKLVVTVMNSERLHRALYVPPGENGTIHYPLAPLISLFKN
jgi:hypothetical protein